jgi:hypothetical protein
MKKITPVVLCLTMMSGLAMAAGAQTTQTTTQQTTNPATGQTTTTVTKTYVDSKCGRWDTDTWISNNTCVEDASDVTTMHKHERLSGTITSVSGNMVTIQQADRTVVINDQPALNRKTSGQVAVGRTLVAHGYWDAGTFYATILN